jgi:hypothetical protein
MKSEQQTSFDSHARRLQRPSMAMLPSSAFERLPIHQKVDQRGRRNPMLVRVASTDDPLTINTSISEAKKK